MVKFAGLDVHSKWSAYVIRDQDGAEIARGKFDTTEPGIDEFVTKHELGTGDTIGMESGSVSFFITRRLMSASKAKVLVIDAREVREKARSKKKKSDFRDAEDISDGLVRRAYVRIVYVPSAWEQATKDALSKRDHFVSVMRGEVCSAKSILSRQGKRGLYKTLESVASWQRLTGHDELDALSKRTLKGHLAVWTVAKRQVDACEKELTKLEHERQEECDRLQTIPGVGPIVALTVLAYLGDTARFSEAKKVSSYAGLCPSTYDSVKTGRHGHITREGSPFLRKMLVLAAQHGGRNKHPLYGSFVKIRAKKSRKTAVVATASRLARICYAMLEHKKDFDWSRYQSPKWAELASEPSKSVTA